MTAAAQRAPAHRAERAPSGFGAVLRLLLRSHRMALLAWIIPLLAVVAVVIPAYDATYPELSQREVLVEQMRETSGTRIMYGILHTPGTLGQMFVWEMGTYVLVLTAIMAVLLAVASTRAAEEAGTLELVRAGGVRAWVPLAAAMVLVVGAVASVAAGSTVLLLAQIPSVGEHEVSVGGSLAFGAVTALCGWCAGAVALCLAQLFPEARSARAWSLGFVGAAFALRIVADQAVYDDGWPSWLESLNWLTPLGWREVIGPFDDDRFWAAVPLLATCVVLAATALILHSRREHDAGVLRGGASSERRLRVGAVESWAWTSARGQVIGWSVVVVLLSALFGSMTSGLVSTLQESERTRELWEQMTGSAGGAGAPDEAQLLSEYFQFLGVFMALIIAIFAVSAVLRWRGQERDGLMDLELAVGTRRWRSLAARCTIAGICSAVQLGISGAIMGWLGERQLGGDIDSGAAMESSLAASLGHIPGVWATIGIAALLVAAVPRVSGLSWLPVAWSGFAQLFGELVDLPDAALDVSILAWAVAPGDDRPWAAWLILLGLGLVGSAAASVLIGRRDVGP